MINNKVAICLHQTSHPGNIGSVARAMKTMNLSDLRLIDCVDHNSSDAYAMACGADDILFHAKTYPDLNQALSDCHLVFGLSARPRTDKRKILLSTQLNEVFSQITPSNQLAFLFGNERTGLDNAALSLCHSQIIIPTNPDYHSLNLSQAVQIIAYLVSTYERSPKPFSLLTKNVASHEKKAAIIYRLEQLLAGSKLINIQNPQSSLSKVLDILHRAQLDNDEADLLCGILKQLHNGK